MESTKALIIFCEGAHDVAFLSRIFRTCENTTEVREKFSAYPAPFNQFFKTNVERHAAQDLTLDMAKKFFLPDKVFCNTEWMFLLFNSGGASQYEKVKDFLKDFILLFDNAQNFPEGAKYVVQEVKYLFFYDADHRTPNDVAVLMQKEFNSIENTLWKLNEWEIITGTKGTTQEDKALYIWANETGSGTLEDIILPIYNLKNADLLTKSTAFVSDAFDWSEAGKPNEQISKIRSSKSKATICVAGQGLKPGAPLSAIIHDNVLASSDAIKSDVNVKNLILFLNNFIGSELLK